MTGEEIEKVNQRNRVLYSAHQLVYSLNEEQAHEMINALQRADIFEKPMEANTFVVRLMDLAQAVQDYEA